MQMLTKNPEETDLQNTTLIVQLQMCDNYRQRRFLHWRGGGGGGFSEYPSSLNPNPISDPHLYFFHTRFQTSKMYTCSRR